MQIESWWFNADRKKLVRCQIHFFSLSIYYVYLYTVLKITVIWNMYIRLLTSEPWTLDYYYIAPLLYTNSKTYLIKGVISSIWKKIKKSCGCQEAEKTEWNPNSFRTSTEELIFLQEVFNVFKQSYQYTWEPSQKKNKEKSIYFHVKCRFFFDFFFVCKTVKKYFW